MIETQVPTRDAFVRKIRDYHLAPLWDVLPKLITAEPNSVIAPYRWRYAKCGPHLLESTRSDHGEGSRAPRPGPREPATCAVESKITRQPVRRPADHHAGRGRAAAPPRPAALRFIIEGNGAYTAVDGERTYHAARRLRHHAGVDVARSRQRERAARWCGSTASTCTSSTCAKRASAKADPSEDRDGAGEAGARLALPLRRTTSSRSSIPTAGRRRRSSAIPYDRTREALEAMRARRRPEPLVRLQDALHQPAHRRRRDPDDQHVHAAHPARDDDPDYSRDRQHGVRRRRGAGDDAHRRSELRLGAARHHRRPELGTVRAHRRGAATPSSSATRTAASKRCSGYWRDERGRDRRTARRARMTSAASTPTRHELEVAGCTVSYQRAGYAAHRCCICTAASASPAGSRGWSGSRRRTT